MLEKCIGDDAKANQEMFEFMLFRRNSPIYYPGSQEAKCYTTLEVIIQPLNLET